MVQQRVPSVVLVAFLCLSMAVAGCVDEETPSPKAQDQPDPTASMPPMPTNGTKGPLVTVDTKDALFAPQWRQGMTWTYAVSGSLFPRPYETKIGVVAVGDDRYEMGTESQDELMNYAHFDGGVLLGGVAKETLAVSHAGAEQDLFGFLRPIGDTWKITLFHEGFTMTRPAPSDVQHGLGTARGLSIAAPGTVGNLTVVYATDVGNLALLRWTDGEHVFLEYKLTAYEPSAGIAGLKQWLVLGRDNGDASGPPNNVGFEQWQSDGAGSLVFLRVHLRATTASGAVVVDPSGDVAAQVTGEGTDADTVQDLVVPDEAGTWNMVLWNDSGAIARGPPARSDVFLYQIQETAF